MLCFIAEELYGLVRGCSPSKLHPSLPSDELVMGYSSPSKLEEF